MNNYDCIPNMRIVLTGENTAELTKAFSERNISSDCLVPASGAALDKICSSLKGADIIFIVFDLQDEASSDLAVKLSGLISSQKRLEAERGAYSEAIVLGVISGSTDAASVEKSTAVRSFADSADGYFLVDNQNSGDKIDCYSISSPVCALYSIIAHPSIVGIDFADVHTALSDAGRLYFASVHCCVDEIDNPASFTAENLYGNSLDALNGEKINDAIFCFALSPDISLDYVFDVMRGFSDEIFLEQSPLCECHFDDDFFNEAEASVIMSTFRRK